MPDRTREVPKLADLAYPHSLVIESALLAGPKGLSQQLSGERKGLA